MQLLMPVNSSTGNGSIQSQVSLTSSSRSVHCGFGVVGFFGDHRKCPERETFDPSQVELAADAAKHLAHKVKSVPTRAHTWTLLVGFDNDEDQRDQKDLPDGQKPKLNW